MLQLAVPLDYASPELSLDGAKPWRGGIQAFEPLVGIDGWALSVESPDEPVELELTVGGDVFALTVSDEVRPEIDRALGVATRCGFRFGPEIFGRLARLSDHRRDYTVAVRIAGTNISLRPVNGRTPSVGELVLSWRAAVLGATTPVARPVGRGERLLARLSALRTQAEPLRDRPLRPLSDHDVGQIDAVHPASESQVWLVGWMKRGIEPDLPAAIVDRQKFPSGMAVLQYERADLPTSSVGFIAVLDTAWAPPVVMKDGFVYLGRQGQYHLRYGPQTRLLRAEAFLTAFGQAQPLPGGHAEAMAALLHSGSNWLPGNAAATGVAAEAGIDRLLLLPGFGCLAEGWAVSPAKRIVTFHMKIGDGVLVADEAATSFRARPDLQSVFGNVASVVSRAGFATVLRGSIGADASGAPLLRVVHEDGSMAVQRVEPKILRRLDPVADGEEILRLFPALRHEGFYSDFLACAARVWSQRSGDMQSLALRPARRAIVMRLPSDISNLNLCLDRLSRHAADFSPDIGIALLCDQGRARGEALLRLEELARQVSAPLSLFMLSHENDALAELPAILGRMGAERFVHLGRGIVPTATGWVAVQDYLDRHGHAIERFEIVDDVGSPDRVDGAVSAAAFGWTTPALLEWSLSAPRFSRGLYKNSGLPQTPGRDRVARAAMMRVERPRAARLADMLDEDLLRSTEEAVRP
ncbi:hypothetical protein ASG43_08605 [Aureimonas sp. Leaf454]|uniref:hypothetical protein n=1 Tax=Aureimonas sp. Leaf454 TaxID=1736381 RepID=UPI0006F9B863|nr:hypothetical protein [Aureimonas sp. Leaf454]KQT48891.1 hypothetical protein ASG43_08605 [Aureimonas sp. Leaf454]